MPNQHKIELNDEERTNGVKTTASLGREGRGRAGKVEEEVTHNARRCNTLPEQYSHVLTQHK